MREADEAELIAIRAALRATATRLAVVRDQLDRWGYRTRAGRDVEAAIDLCARAQHALTRALGRI